MGAAGEAGAEAQRRGVDLVDAEQGKPGDRADDIDQGVGGADLVQVDLVDRGAVDLRLGRGDERVSPPPCLRPLVLAP